MYEMTLEGLIRAGNSDYATNNARWLIIEVSVDGSTPEIIINPKENFTAKLNYYSNAYNSDLTLKVNPTIKIVSYDFVENMTEYWEGKYHDSNSEI